MIKIYLISIGIIMMILTVTVGIVKPGINKQVQFTQNDFQITNTELAQNPDATHKLPEEKVKIVNTELQETKNVEKTIITTDTKINEITKVVENKENTSVKNIQIKKTPEKIKTETKTIKTTSPKSQTKTVSTTQTQKPTTQEKTVEIPKSVKDILNKKNSPEQQKPEQKESKPVKLPQVNPTQTAEQIQKTIETVPENERPLTEQEEIIVWNIWRSNLQNQIMKDTQIAAPIGTTFKFSFTVDKRGQISNLKTWAVPSSYNSIAINYLKPLILSYQGKSILNFPARTKRVITNVTGGFVISTQDRFSTPNDFQDIERIKTLR